MSGPGDLLLLFVEEGITKDEEEICWLVGSLKGRRSRGHEKKG